MVSDGPTHVRHRGRPCALRVRHRGRLCALRVRHRGRPCAQRVRHRGHPPALSRPRLPSPARLLPCAPFAPSLPADTLRPPLLACVVVTSRPPSHSHAEASERCTIASQGHSSATQEKLVFEALQPITTAFEDRSDGRPASRMHRPDYVPDVEHDGDM
jgi:hypothetical protein